MIFMFVVGILLALSFGFTVGVLYVKWERSVFTKKFASNIKKITEKEQARIDALHAADQIHLDEMKKEIDNILLNSMAAVDAPPREDYN